MPDTVAQKTLLGLAIDEFPDNFGFAFVQRICPPLQRLTLLFREANRESRFYGGKLAACKTVCKTQNSHLHIESSRKRIDWTKFVSLAAETGRLAACAPQSIESA